MAYTPRPSGKHSTCRNEEGWMDKEPAHSLQHPTRTDLEKHSAGCYIVPSKRSKGDQLPTLSPSACLTLPCSMPARNCGRHLCGRLPHARVRCLSAGGLPPAARSSLPVYRECRRRLRNALSRFAISPGACGSMRICRRPGLIPPSLRPRSAGRALGQRCPPCCRSPEAQQ
jgi:hypothetical protein